MKNPPKISKKLRKVESEKENTQFVYKINVAIVGSIRLERAIDRYLQETIENYFLENGEFINFIEIESAKVYK